jgi:hypothetical protein
VDRDTAHPNSASHCTPRLIFIELGRTPTFVLALEKISRYAVRMDSAELEALLNRLAHGECFLALPIITRAQLTFPLHECVDRPNLPCPACELFSTKPKLLAS